MSMVGHINWDWGICCSCMYANDTGDECAVNQVFDIGQDPESLETCVLCMSYKPQEEVRDDNADGT